MTRQLSYNAEMARRVLAMTVGLPINSDPGLREDTFCLVGISDILDAAHCFADVEREMRETNVLNSECRLDSVGYIEALKWVLDVTKNPIQVLYILCGDRTLYFLTDGENTGSLFDNDRLHFFEEYCRRKLSVRKRLQLAAEAVQLGERGVHAKLDMFEFAKGILADMNLLRGCPAYHRRNLLCVGLERLMELGSNTYRIEPGPHLFSTADIIFGIKDMTHPAQG